MAITGTHMLFYSSEPDALRATLRGVFGFQSVDADSGWLIFALPPAELGVHPADAPESASGRHQISFMCDDIQATVADLRLKGVRIDAELQDEDWGIHVMMTLPGSIQVMLYEPRHRTAI